MVFSNLFWSTHQLRAKLLASVNKGQEALYYNEDITFIRIPNIFTNVMKFYTECPQAVIHENP